MQRVGQRPLTRTLVSELATDRVNRDCQFIQYQPPQGRGLVIYIPAFSSSLVSAVARVELRFSFHENENGKLKPKCLIYNSVLYCKQMNTLVNSTILIFLRDSQAPATQEIYSETRMKHL
jgi:hypothetical protein